MSLAAGGQDAAPLHSRRRRAGAAFASLWDHWRDRASGEDVLSCTIIVSGASNWMKPYNDRMLVLLGEGDFDGWLSDELGGEDYHPVSSAF